MLLALCPPKCILHVGQTRITHCNKHSTRGNIMTHHNLFTRTDTQTNKQKKDIKGGFLLLRPQKHLLAILLKPRAFSVYTKFITVCIFKRNLNALT